MSGGEGFGPVGPVAAEGPPFTVAGPASVALDAARSGAASFTVSNVTGRPVRARLLVLPGTGADASWFQVVGESERALPVAGTATVDVSVKVPEKAPAGSFSFAVGAALEEAPDQVVSGPTVAFQVPQPKKRKFPWWIVIVVVALLLLAGGGALIWALTRPDDPPPTQSPTPTPTPTPEVLTSDTLSFWAGDAMIDFEELEPQVWQRTYCKFLPGSDLCFSDQDVMAAGFPAFEPLSVRSTSFAGVAIAPDGEYDTCVAALSDPSVSSGVSIPDLPIRTYVCFITGERHFGVLEIWPQDDGEAERRVRYTIWEGQA